MAKKKGDSENFFADPNSVGTHLLPSDSLRFNPSAFHIPEAELEESFARSGGPGGQNVNKRSTKVLLRWNIRESLVLSPQQKEKLLNNRLIKSRLDSEGNILVQDRSSRHQGVNREEALRKLEALVKKALTESKPRKRSKPTCASKQKRLNEKKQRSDVKRSRQKRDW